MLAGQLMAAELYQEGHPPHDWTPGVGLVNGKETRYAQVRWSPIASPPGWSLVTPTRAGACCATEWCWLLLVNQLGKIRDPAALPGWLATTTRRECTRVLNKAQARQASRCELDAENIPDGQAETIEQGLLAAERQAALREAFTHLSPPDQQLIALLIEDPPVPYAQISAGLGIPVGSIGPNRRRCLDKLRHHPAIAELISAEAQTA